MSQNDFRSFCPHSARSFAGEPIPMVMKINTGLGNPCPFQEPFIYEATSFLYKSPYLDSVHITVYLT